VSFPSTRMVTNRPVVAAGGLCVGVALDVGAETLARRRAQGSGAILGEAQTLGVGALGPSCVVLGFSWVKPVRCPQSVLRARKREVRSLSFGLEHPFGSVRERLIEAAKQNRSGHRDATAILVAYRHGLRASELVALRWDDIDLALVEMGLFIAVLLFGYYWVAREE
jgi:Phage integrase family